MDSHLRWSSLLLRSLYDRGSRYIIVSPGSRSTPLTVAAAIHDGFKKSIAIDERSAAFIALGIGKATGIPAILICTSGTAGANYLPAVVEARESGVPMIILTADRPPNLRGIGSSQTIDQIGLFGRNSVFFHEAGEPHFEAGDLKRLTYLGKQAFEESMRIGGAAHINLPFRKPLEPVEEDIEQELLLNRKQIESNNSQAEDLQRTLYLPKSVIRLIQSAKRPLIIAGPANPGHALRLQLTELAGLINAPVIAEPGSGVAPPENLRIERYEQFLRKPSIQDKLSPDLIIRFGDQPFTKSLLMSMDHWESKKTPVIHFQSRLGTQDHAMNITHSILCSVTDQIDTQWDKTVTDTAAIWLKSWLSENRSAALHLKNSIQEQTSLTDGHVFNHISRQIDTGWKVMLSNSFIPRDMALFGKSSQTQFVNRGAAGIDGIISTAVGIHRAEDRPVLCITGDIAFLHDSNALLSIRNMESPFIILVVNNGGGTIFRMLPVYGSGDFYSDYFETPQHVDLEFLAKAHGIDYKKIDSITSLNTLRLNQLKSARIVECKTDPEASMRLRKRLWNQGKE